MVKQSLKKKNNRQSARHKANIDKKIGAHNKKVTDTRKSAKKAKRKDPGILNSLPFKVASLEQAEDRKRQLEEERQKAKDRQKINRGMLLTKKRNLESLVKDAEIKTKEYEKKTAKMQHIHGDGQEGTKGKAIETSRKAYFKEFKKVVNAADVLLEVLDARDPLGSRCAELEQTILNAGTNKRLVLLLNKIDLVPKENVEAWLKHLRNEFPAVAFKASTQAQNDNLSQVKIPLSVVSEDMMKSSRCIGADMLMKLLGSYCQNKGIRTSIRVGVVGFPNTGKSSIINSLKRSKVCNIGAAPGITKNMQEVQLDKHIMLLDSPGVVMAQKGSDTSIILRNCVKLESLGDPMTPVEAILRRCNKDQMITHYKLSDYKDVSEFLSLLGRRMGKLKKGGIPDVNKAARQVLHDWNSGRITYFTHPPESQLTHVSATFVKEMGHEFNIGSLESDEQIMLQSLEPQSSKHMAVESLGMTKMLMADHEIDDEKMSDSVEDDMDDETGTEIGDLQNVTISSCPSRAEPKSKIIIEKTDTQLERAGNIQSNKAKKVEYKKMKKQRKKSDKLAGSLSDALTKAFSFGEQQEAGDGDDSYNFL